MSEYVLRTDGASLGNGREDAAGGYGFVLSKADAVVRSEGGPLGVGRGMTNNFAEYQGFIRGIDATRGVLVPGDRLVVQTDSTLVVGQTRGSKAVHAEHLLPLREEAMRLLGGLTGVTWSVAWIPRERNTEADALAKEGAREARRRWESGEAA